MSRYNDYEGGGRQGAGSSKREVINEWKAVGVLRSRYGKDDEELKYTPYPNGGGVVHATLVVISDTGVVDQSTGAPKMRTLYKLIDISTNKLISEQQLRSLKTGMKVRIVSSLASETYTSKRDGQKHTQEIAKVYVLEILEMPSPQPVYQGAPAYPGYPAQPQGAYPPPQPQGGYPAPQQGGYPPQQGYQPQGGYPAPQGAYPPPAGYGPSQPPQQGGYPPQQGYQPHGGYPPQQGGYPAPAGNVRPAPAYTPQPPAAARHQGATPPPPAQPPMGPEDMPAEYMDINV